MAGAAVRHALLPWRSSHEERRKYVVEVRRLWRRTLNNKGQQSDRKDRAYEAEVLRGHLRQPACTIHHVRHGKRAGRECRNSTSEAGREKIWSARHGVGNQRIAADQDAVTRHQDSEAKNA